MRSRFAAPFIVFQIVLLGAPTLAHAYEPPPTALALVASRNRYIARTPAAMGSLAPKKIVAADGRESLGVKTTATKVYIADQESGATLYAVNADELSPIASITKLMTARILRERGLDWNAKVTVTVIADGGGAAYFAPNDVVTVRDLWRAMLIGSSNTAAVTLVRTTGLTLEEFVAAMNDNATALGMAHTRFVDPTGLDKDNVSTARELAVLVRAAFADPEISGAVTTASFDLKKTLGKKRHIDSTNKLLTSFMNKKPYRILGGKTGYIVESGYNFALSITSENTAPVIVVVLGSATNDSRFQEAKSLAYWAFQNYRWPKNIAGVLVP